MTYKVGSKIDWLAIRHEFVTGHIDLKSLSEKHNINHATVRQRAKRENWSRERHLLSQKVTAAVVKTATEEKIEILNKWNQDSIKEAEMLRMAARTLFMERAEDGKLKIKRGLTGSDLSAAHNANIAADRLVRLATDAATAKSELDKLLIEKLRRELQTEEEAHTPTEIVFEVYDASKKQNANNDTAV
jgi:hypothetical protein